MTIKHVNNHSVISRKQITEVFNSNCKQENICPVKDILARFGDKWSIYVVLLLRKNEKFRFNELKSGIDGISQRMLTVTLRSLEEDGFVSRTIHREIPSRVEYQLTDIGKSLSEQLLQMVAWADNNSTEIINARKNYIQKTSQ